MGDLPLDPYGGGDGDLDLWLKGDLDQTFLFIIGLLLGDFGR